MTNMDQCLKKENLCVAALLCILLAISFYDVIFLGKTFKVTTSTAQVLETGPYEQANNKPRWVPVNGTDGAILEEPIYEFIRNNLRKGILPFWNPHQACGFPLIAMMETAIFFPLTFLVYILPEMYAWDALMLSRFFVAGFLCFLFMRRLGFKKIPSLTAGITFMLSGPMVLLQYWTVNVDILTPLLLLTLNELIKKTDLKHAAYLALTVGLTFFAGHPEHIFLVNVYGILFLLYRAWSLRKRVASIPKLVLYTALGYVLGVGLSSVVLFPFLYNLFTELWHGHPDNVGLFNEEVRERILSIIVPHFFQKENLKYSFEFAGWWGGYLGVLPIGLSVLSLWNNHKKGLNYFFFILGFLIISKAYGFFYINWIGHLPLFSVCRYAIHTPHLAAFTFAVLTGMGVKTALLNKKVFTKGLFYSVGLLLVVAIYLFINRNAPHFPLSVKASLFTVGVLLILQAILFLKDKNILKREHIALLLLGLIFLELFLYIHRERPRRFNSFTKPPYIKFLESQPERGRAYGYLWAFYPDTATGLEVDDLGVFCSLLSKRFVNFVNNLINSNIFKADLRPPALRTVPLTMGTPFLDLLNVKYTITPNTATMAKMLIPFKEENKFRTPTVYKSEVDIYPRADAFPRAFIVHRVVFEPEEEKAYLILRRFQIYLREFAVLNHSTNPLILSVLNKAPVKDNSTARIITYSPNEVIIDVEMEHPGLLVLSDTYHPEWKVLVDNKPDTILITDTLLRSVFLNKGKHRVRFIFYPASFYKGMAVSVICLLIIVLLLNGAAIKKMSRSSP